MDEQRSRNPRLADEAAHVAVSAPTSIGHGFRPFERFSVEIEHGAGNPVTLSRDILRTGRTVALLAVDLVRDEVVLIRQFRLAAHLETGRGEIVELPAGYVEPGEPVIEAARRECIEEIGVVPQALREVFAFMPAPGMLQELGTIFLAAIDAAAVPEHAGASDEVEHTRPVRLSIDEALAALGTGALCNGYLLLALQWLALNRGDLARLLADFPCPSSAPP